MAETTVGSFKNELIHRQGPWGDVDQVELGTAEWVAWFNTERPHEHLDDLTPRPSRSITTLTDIPCRGQGDPTTEVSGLAGAAQGAGATVVAGEGWGCGRSGLGGVGVLGVGVGGVGVGSRVGAAGGVGESGVGAGEVSAAGLAGGEG